MKISTFLKPIGVALCLSIFISNPSLAQEKNDANWVADFYQNVNWQRVTPFGMVVVSTDGGLHGLDPESGKIAWTNKELKNMDENSYQPIEESPFVQIATGGESPTIYILEAYGGTIVFNSKEVGIKKLKDSYVLPKNLSILVQGYHLGAKDPSLYMIDLATGKKLWEKHDEFGMLTAFKELGNNEFLLSTLWKIYKINSKSGDITWERPIDEETSKQLAKLGGLGSALKGMAENSLKPGDVLADFYLLDDGNFIIGYQAKSISKNKDSQGKVTVTISYSSGYKCMSLANGENVWNENVSFNGKRGVIIFDKEGLIVCPNAGSNTRVNMVDYKTGAKQWGKNLKGIKVKGGVVEYIQTEAGVLLVLSKGGSPSSDPTYLMNLLDQSTGTLKFEKYLKLKGNIETTELLSDALFYSTDKEANIVKLSDGTNLFPKSIKTATNLTVSNQEKIYIFSPKDKALFEIEKKSMSYRQLSVEDIKFEGKEIPNELEVRKEGVAIIGMQNIALVDFDGKPVYQKYYVAPKLPSIMRALNAAMAVRAAYIGVVASVVSAELAVAAEQSESEAGQVIAGGLSDAYGELGAAGFSYANKYMAAVNKRFTATANSPDFIFMLTVGDGRKDNRLIRVNKDTGEVMDYVSLGKDKEPVYEVDNISNQIYYRKEPEKISCFTF